MLKKILTFIGTGVGLIATADWLGRRITGQWLWDIIVRKLGIQGGIRAIPFWIRLIIVSILLFLVIKYDKLFDKFFLSYFRNMWDKKKK